MRQAISGHLPGRLAVTIFPNANGPHEAGRLGASNHLNLRSSQLSNAKIEPSYFTASDAALQEDLETKRMTAADLIRMLVREIILTPEDGELQIDVRGDFAGILAISLKSKRPAGGRAVRKLRLLRGQDLEPAEPACEARSTDELGCSAVLAVALFRLEPPSKSFDQVCTTADPDPPTSFMSARNSAGGARQKVRKASKNPSHCLFIVYNQPLTQNSIS
ncbi:hypothetical protein [Mesorhizobium sp. M0220]|uniref:hypothetical protein n=2 Tax=unclassified Mesorhizobium TaxID=325217 RepID=UPI0033364D22